MAGGGHERMEELQIGQRGGWRREGTWGRKDGRMRGISLP